MPPGAGALLLTLQRLVVRLDLRELLRGTWSSPPSSSSNPSSDWRPPSKGSRTGPLDLIAQRRTLLHLAVPRMGEVHLREGRVTYRDYASHTEMAATLAEVHATTTDVSSG